MNDYPETRVRLQDKVFAPRLATAKTVTIPAVLEQCRKTGRIAAFDLAWQPDAAGRPHPYFDSDVAKLVEGMAYMLMLEPDDGLRAELDELVVKIISAQQPDGYLNTYYTQLEPEKRFTDLLYGHELYCAGHLIEAAVAYEEATGNRNFTRAMLRYTEYLYTLFGPGGARRGCPGHEEIELALIRLYECTGEKHCLELARQFLDVRGAEPNSFCAERPITEAVLANRQAHKPVRDQTAAEGHAVRALYLYRGMAMVGHAAGDESLLRVVRRIFANLTGRRMYITGGIGSSSTGEAFTCDYDLPNGSSYAESCAAIALAFLARTMLEIEPDGFYGDIMERVLYNGALSGISLSGDRFFYANLLESTAATFEHEWVWRERREWFGCSCCPTSFARFLPQLGTFCCRELPDGLRIDIPAAAAVDFARGGIAISGNYPYDGDIGIQIVRGGEFTLHLRIPGWCREWSLEQNGCRLAVSPEHGYLRLTRRWRAGEQLQLRLAMPVRLVRADSRVAACDGLAAVVRGPLVYCLESMDNPDWQPGLGGWRDDPAPVLHEAPTGLPDSAVSLEVSGYREVRAPGEMLYSATPVEYIPVRWRLIPYALWQNRGSGTMKVFLPVRPRSERHSMTIRSSD